ncbi:MAG TPA: hypothetical protein VJZ76_01740 [Thermoanaerobaculia bacterium]|nr:hypothetical protein [Thermoanaerobaculia bacterium]
MVKKTVSATVRQRSERVRTAVSVLWAICWLLVIAERFSAATIRLFADDFAAAALRHLLCEFAAATPEALLLWALWRMRATLDAFARGEWFAAPITRMLDQVGVLLACGAALRILIVPGACRLLGESSGYWIAFDAAALVLGAIGLALKAIAGVLRAASAIQSELDEIF